MSEHVPEDDEKPPGHLDPAAGGRARAEKLTPEERQEIARRAAEARWQSDLPQAAHGSPDHPLRIGDIEIPCYVLEDGTRVITNRGIQRGLGMAQSGGAQRMANMVGVFESKGIDGKDLTSRIATPIEFRLPGVGSRAFGYEATVLADLCDVILAARKAGLLQKQQEHIAEQAEILARGFMRVGIIALVDEATGYQQFRARHALEEILERFIAKELLKWAKMFPDEFYEQMFRLRGWKFNQIPSKRPALAGKLTNNLVYERLAPGVLDELRRITPRDAKGRLKHKYFQRLTEDVGHPRLREHLASVITLMRAFNDWDSFYQAIQRALPKQVKMPLLDWAEENRDESPSEDADAQPSD
jgi:hypothetical protein